ncbi:MAG: hypothetical protein IIX09_08995, partial [Clostridia bacterium]|nr:hypothetical protein [Clostridia bacterium]
MAVIDTYFTSDTGTACRGISFVSDTEGYIVFESGYWSMGRVYHTIAKTTDGGKTFVYLNENKLQFDYGENIVFLDSDNYVNVGYFYNGLPKNPIRRGVLGVASQPNYATYWLPDKSTWQLENYINYPISEFPLLQIADGYTPYFDGDIGVVAFSLRGDNYSSRVNDILGYIYYITLDGGYTWSLYTGFESDVSKYQNVEVFPSAEDVAYPIELNRWGYPVLKGSNKSMPVRGIYVNIWENDPYHGHKYPIKDLGVHFVSRGVPSAYGYDTSLWREGKLYLSDELVYTVKHAGKTEIDLYHPDGTVESISLLGMDYDIILIRRY